MKPKAVREHAVLVDGEWFPVRQAFEAALGVPRAAFTSHTARRQLAGLGFEVRGEISARAPASSDAVRPRRTLPAREADVPTVPAGFRASCAPRPTSKPRWSARSRRPDGGRTTDRLAEPALPSSSPLIGKRTR